MLLLGLAGCATYPYYASDGVYYGRGYDSYGHSSGGYYYPYPYYAYPGYYGRSFYSFSYYDYSPYYRYPYPYYSGGHDHGRRHDEHPGESGDARRELRRIDIPRRPPTVNRTEPRGRRIHVEAREPGGTARATAPRTGISTPRPSLPSAPDPAPASPAGIHAPGPGDRPDRPRHRDR